MSGLVAALDGEKWGQADVSARRQNTIDNLTSGRAATMKSVDGDGARGGQAGEGVRQNNSEGGGHPRVAKANDANVEGNRFKVVYSCLLLIDMLMSNLAAAATFQSLAIDVVGKVSEVSSI